MEVPRIHPVLQALDDSDLPAVTVLRGHPSVEELLAVRRALAACARAQSDATDGAGPAPAIAFWPRYRGPNAWSPAAVLTRQPAA